MQVLLGIDMGTSSTKGVLVTPDGVVVATAQHRHEVSLPRPGWAEVDAETTWWGDVQRICRELVALAPGPISAVSISGVGPCLVVTDANLRPLRPAILYGIDTRATAEIAALNQRYGDAAILTSGGKQLTSQALGPKLEWVRRHEPEVWARTCGWYGSHSYITAKLTGEYVMDHHSASQSDPLYRTPSFGWHHEWAMEICEPVRLPRLAWPAEVIGTVHAAAAAATGLAVGTPVVAGTMDAFAEAFSVGVRHPGQEMIMYGSTMYVARVLADYSVHHNLWTTAGVEQNTHALSGGTATAGSLTSWVQKLTGGTDFSTLIAEAAATPIGSEGLMVLPYFAGERTPVFDPDARGVIAGLTLRHSRGHLFRAVYEGIGFGIRHLLEQFDEATTLRTTTTAVGGGLQSELWTQTVSDITGRPQLIPTQTIGACYGGALLAAIGAELVPASTDWTTIEREITPNPQAQDAYATLYPIWSELYPATRDQVHRLADSTT